MLTLLATGIGIILAAVLVSGCESAEDEASIYTDNNNNDDWEPVTSSRSHRHANYPLEISIDGDHSVDLAPADMVDFTGPTAAAPGARCPGSSPAAGGSRSHQPGSDGRATSSRISSSASSV